MIQLQFSALAENWIEKLCHDLLASIRVMSVRAEEGRQDQITHFVDISSENATADNLSRRVGSYSDITETDLARVGANRVIGSITSNDCIVCRALVETKTNTFIGPAITEEDCRMNYKIYISGGGLPIFLQRLHKKGVDYKIGDLSPLSSTKGITTRQQKVLRSALELGYYDFPKRITTEELASKLGVSAATVAEILRRAEKNVITRYFEAPE